MNRILYKVFNTIQSVQFEIEIKKQWLDSIKVYCEYINFQLLWFEHVSYKSGSHCVHQDAFFSVKHCLHASHKTS